MRATPSGRGVCSLCGHAYTDPIDATCDQCRKRGEARVRQRKRRGVPTGNNEPLPRLGGITRGQVTDLFKAADDAQNIRGHLLQAIYQHRSRQEPIPPQLQMAADEAKRLAETLKSIANTYERATQRVYPPLKRSK